MATVQQVPPQTTFKLTKLKEAHLSSITCVDWIPRLPNRIMSGSEDKFIKVWDIRTKKCGISLNLTSKGEISDITSNHTTIFAATSDYSVYEFDTRLIRQKDSAYFLKCNDEISQIIYDNKCNSLFIGDDIGKVTKYDLNLKKITQSICFHNNALCTSITTIPELNIGFTGGTDAQLHQFNTNNLINNSFSYSMQDMITHNNNNNNNNVIVNPPFIYSLDSKILNKDNKQLCVAIALGNGNIALFAPKITDNDDNNNDNDNDNDDNKDNADNVDDDIINDPICCVDMHQSAACDISFGYNNNWLVSAGTDKYLRISDWKFDNNELSIINKFKIPLKEKPNSMVCTGNDIAQIVVADLSNSLSMYSLKS